MDTLILNGKKWNFHDVDFIVKNKSFDYIQPSFSCKTEIKNSRYIVVSASGAVGKSAYGSHLSSSKNAMLWDLSKLQLGSNTFIGSITKSVGAENLSVFLRLIKEGKILLVFDAIDEAELHSGKEGVRDFILDVINYTKNSKQGAVVFLARHDSALMVGNILKEKNEKYCEYEIGFFSKQAATNFVLSQISTYKDRNGANGKDFIHSHRSVIENKIKEAFSMPVATSFSKVDDNNCWTDKTQESFFGYAPVLQTIAQLFSDTANSYKIEFSDLNGCARIVCDILTNLMRREKLKFNDAASKKLGERFDKNELENVYSIDDQIDNILRWVADSWYVEENKYIELNGDINKEVNEMIRSFLPQHPFLKRKDFAGPAFRDYILASGLLNSGARFFSEYFINEREPLFTPIFSNVYMEISDGAVNINDVGFLYESFRESVNNNIDEINLNIFVKEEGRLFGFIDNNDDGGAFGKSQEFYLTDGVDLRFYRRLVNAKISTNGNVILGSPNGHMSLVDCEIFAKKISFDSSYVSFKNNVSDQFVISSESRIETPHNFKIDAIKNEEIYIVSPNSKEYPWIQFKNEINNDADVDVDVDTVLHVMSRILSWFRKDRRDEYGRYKDLVNKHAVGNSKTAQHALGFIKYIGALSEDDKLYYMDVNKLTDIGISWKGIRDKTTSDEAKRIVSDYLKKC